MKSALKSLVLGAFVVIVLVPNLSRANEKNFKKNHPRRAQVVGREKNEIRKNNEAAEDGKITNRQRNKLNAEDRAIRREERADAAANGGHITKEEQRDLNRQENRVNRQRNNMEKRDAAKPNGVGAPAAPPAAGN